MKVLLLVLGFVLLLSPDKVYSQEQAASPYHAKVQYAGSLGLVSLGAGRSFFHEKLETDVFLGYLPEKFGGDRIFTAALKATYVPFKPIPIRSVNWQPLRTGLQLGYTFGDEYFVSEPRDKYPKSYYGFPTALHLYLYLGGQVDFTRKEKLSRFGVYYEVGSSAEYLISYIQNPKYLGPGKIFNLALGLRMRL
ncbi:hypothetical protein H9Q13_17630 [Pontibacter sp. JH31]|uniref:Outer membrane protein beta-barrel domain-containing protein n=1 Tax=Pontibacter aquaedesilientis TaxID=2766980 RepID=A0ABR7XL46_9BACT|nr:hypothetical protein [Pontibacter aquaedesilientis]MBD1398994.1 hypothetical protein [Pontibacter aquaedesilientis]